MAIIDALPGVKVTIESQGKTLPEYEDDTDLAQWHFRQDYNLQPHKWMSTYVECESDAEFKIKFSMGPPFKTGVNHLCFCVSIDGKSIACHSAPSTAPSPYSFSIARSYERLSEHEIGRRSLKFASLQKVDEADAAKVKSDGKLAAGLGEILVAVYWARIEKHNGAIPLSKLENAPAKIAEKALKGKAISHGVSFGEVVRERKETKQAVLVGGVKNPLAIVVFKYRSRQALQTELIIPRSPSPEVAESSLHPRSTNVNQESREQRIARLQRELDEVKAEPKVKGENDARGRKRSWENELLPAREYRTIRKRNGDVVYDLTEDDRVRGLALSLRNDPNDLSSAVRYREYTSLLPHMYFFFSGFWRKTHPTW